MLLVFPITVRTNDQPHRKGIDEDSTAFNNVPNTAEEDAYNVACWKVVRNKRLARNAAALEAASPLPTDSENPRAEPRPSVAHRLPPLPFRYEKLVLRPFGGLRLDLWPRQTLATALWATARVSPNDRRNLILRTRPEQNLAVLSTLSLHVTDAPLKLQELSLGQRTYPVSAYLAASGDSCEEYLVLEPGTTSHRRGLHSRSKAQTRSKSRYPIPLPVTFTKPPEEASFYPSITGLPITLQEGIIRQAGNYNRYHGA
ncbi:hypothetical protein MRX96_044167 [Rhipicephalus microplus]